MASVELYSETVIKKPRKKYTCEMCRKEIVGHHIKCKGLFDGGFFAFRAHDNCAEEMKDVCSDCSWRSDCESDVCDCFSEYVSDERKKELEEENNA